MSPKIIESKFIIRGEDDASPQLNKIATGLEKLKGKLSDLHNVKIIDESQFDKINRTLGFTASNAKKLEEQFKKLHSTLNQINLQQRRQQSQPGEVRATAVSRSSREDRTNYFGGGRTTAQAALGPTTIGNANNVAWQRSLPIPKMPKGVEIARPGVTPPPTSIIKVLVTNWPTSLGGRGGATGAGGGGTTTPTTTLKTEKSPAEQAQQQSNQHVENEKKKKAEEKFANTPAGKAFGAVHGIALRAPGTMASATQGAMGGNALSTFGAAGMSAGAGIAGLLGGAGAIFGLPLMWKAMKLLVAHAAVQPAIQYAQQGMGVANRIGETALNRQAGFATAFGYMPGQTAQIMGQLGQVGAWAAMKPLAQLRGKGFEAEEMVPYFQALTKAGGAGGRTEGDYNKIARQIGMAVKEKTQIPEFMSQLIALTSSQENYLADISDSDNKTLLAITKWGTESNTSALRGERGARNIGAIQGWMGREGSPAEEMLKWRMYGNKFGGGEEGYWKYLKERGSPEAAMEMLGQFTKMPGRRGEILATRLLNWNPKSTEAIFQAYRTGDYAKARGLVEKEGGALPTGLDKATGDIGNIAKSLAAADWGKIGIGLGKAATIIESEQMLMKSITDVVLGKGDWGASVHEFATAVQHFVDSPLMKFFSGTSGEATNTGTRPNRTWAEDFATFLALFKKTVDPLGYGKR